MHSSFFKSPCIPVLLILSITVPSCQHKAEEKEETVTYKTTRPIVLDTSYTKDYVAQIQAVRNIEVRAQEKGYLQNIFVDEGQQVREGQLMFRIMPKLYEAEVLKAQAEVKQTELELLNTKTLAEKNIVSKTELSIAQAKLDQAKAVLALAQLHLSLTDIKAPFDGTVDRIRFKVGSLIDEGTQLTTLSDNKSVFAYFNVSESEYLDYMNRTNPKQKIQVDLLLANNELHKHSGIVETIESEFDNSTGNIAFRAKFPNPELLLKHGETGKVRMTMPIRQAIIIPQKATYEIQDKIFVYLIDEVKVAHSRQITVKNSLSNVYSVGAGLTEKDMILLEGLQKVRDDDKIEFEYVEPAELLPQLQLIKH